MGNDLTDAENAALVIWTRERSSHASFLAAVREAIRITERRYEQAENARLVLAEAAARKLATALDEVGSRIYSSINPDSSYEPWDEQTAQKLSDFTAYAEQHLAVLDDPNVRQVLAAAKEGPSR